MHDFPIQGPRTTHWLLLEIARSDLGLVTRLSSSVAVWDAQARHAV